MKVITILNSLTKHKEKNKQCINATKSKILYHFSFVLNKSSVKHTAFSSNKCFQVDLNVGYCSFLFLI